MTRGALGKLAAKLAVTVGLLWWVLRDIDLKALAEKLVAISPWSLAAPVAGILLLGLLQTARWQCILLVMGARLEYRFLNKITMLSLFFNQTLPSTVGGDLIRVHHSQRAGIDLRVALSSVVVDRGLGMMTLLIICAGALPGLYGIAGDSPLWWSTSALTILGICGGITVLSLPLLPAAVGRWPVVRLAISFSRATWRLVVHKRHLAFSLLISTTIQAGMILAMAYLGWLLGAPVALTQGLIIYPVVLLVSMVPVSIAGWGIREGAMVVGLGLVDVLPSTALSLSLLYGVVLVLVGVVGGLVWEVEQFGQRRKERARRESHIN